MSDRRSKASRLDRRQLLKSLALGAVVTTLSRPVRAAATGKLPRYGMLIDARRCIGCQACTVACKAEFDVPLGVNRSWVEYVEKGSYPNVGRNFVPRLCNHCTYPPCVSVCPTGATWKRAEDGIVVVDPDMCIGCKYCILACPYDARFLNPVTGAADKCDFCLHRISQGAEPACVETCIGGARIFGDLDDPESEVARRVATNPVTVLRPGQGTEPNVFYIGLDHADEQSAGKRNQYVRVTTNRQHQARR